MLPHRPLPKPLVCVVDDDEMVRTSLHMLLGVLDMRVSTYASGAAFLDDPFAQDCDVLILDVRMPGLSGLQVQQLLNERHSEVPILFISGHGDIPMAVRAMRAGALDFLQKPFNDQVLIDWIHSAIARREAARRHAAEAAEFRGRLESLTTREREVLDAVMAGKANKVIAADFGISLKTIEQHRGRVMAKLGVRKVADVFRHMQLLEGPASGSSPGDSTAAPGSAH